MKQDSRPEAELPSAPSELHQEGEVKRNHVLKEVHQCIQSILQQEVPTKQFHESDPISTNNIPHHCYSLKVIHNLSNKVW